MTKPLNTQSKWTILTLIGGVAGFCLVSLYVKKKYTNQTMNQSSLQRNPYCYSWHEANIRGLQVRNQNKLIKVKSETSPLLQTISTTKCVTFPLFKMNMHHQMWNRANTPNRYAPPART